MKKLIIPFIIISLLTISMKSSLYTGKCIKETDKAVQDTLARLKDGTYEGESRSYYTDEPYWGCVSITVKDGLFTKINFLIRDSALHETFDENYEKHFQGNTLYIQQCRNDWNGVRRYPGKLSETQNPDKVDAVSGATWSYNIFKASVKAALENAK